MTLSCMVFRARVSRRTLVMDSMFIMRDGRRIFRLVLQKEFTSFLKDWRIVMRRQLFDLV